VRVAIVDDDRSQCALVQRTCEAHGMGVTPFLLGRPFLRHAAMASFDLAFIDLRLPDIHGFDLLCELQTQSERLARRTPAIVVTGVADTPSMQRAFECGAKDFVTKPICGDALMIRARAVMRQMQPRLFEDAPIGAGPLVLNLATQQILIDGAEAHLSRKEFKILWLLARQAGRIVTRTELARLVWGAPLSSTSRTIDAHVARLRKKLDLDRRARIRLLPVYGVGYRLDVFS